MRISGDGNIIITERNISAESVYKIDISVSLENSGNLFIDDSFSGLSIKTDANIMEYLKIKVTENEISVRAADGLRRLAPTLCEIRVGAKFNEVSVGGALRYDINNKETVKPEINISGACGGKALFTAMQEVRAGVSGASELSLDGSPAGGRIKANISGASRLNADNVIFGASDIELSGASNAVITTASGEKHRAELSGACELKAVYIKAGDLNIGLSGASHIDCSGTAENVRIGLSGASSFSGYELKANNAHVSASGTASANITVNNELKASVSGVSSVNYKGTAVLAGNNAQSFLSSIRHVG